MEDIMSWQKFKLRCRERNDAINIGDYQTALIINDSIYESEFMKYVILTQRRRQLEQQKPELISGWGVCAYYRNIDNVNEGILSIKINLESLLKTATKIMEIKENA